MKPAHRFLFAALLLAALCAGLLCFTDGHRFELATAASAAAGLASVIGLRDLALRQTVQLPTGAATAYTSGIDTCTDSPQADPLGLELLISAPALTTGKLPDTKTLTYTVQHDDDAAFGTVADLVTGALVQTGAGGAGAVAAEARVALPSTVKRYVRLKVTGVATNAPAVGDLATLQLLIVGCC